MLILKQLQYYVSPVVQQRARVLPGALKGYVGGVNIIKGKNIISTITSSAFVNCQLPSFLAMYTCTLPIYLQETSISKKIKLYLGFTVVYNKYTDQGKKALER